MKNIKNKPWYVKPYKKAMHIGFLTCSPVTRILEMNRLLAVGFGDVQVTRDGEVLYSECTERDSDDYPVVQKYENMAKQDPDHDWRIHFFAPLHEEEYQRHRDGYWPMISSGEGFACELCKALGICWHEEVDDENEKHGVFVCSCGRRDIDIGMRPSFVESRLTRHR